MVDIVVILFGKYNWPPYLSLKMAGSQGLESPNPSPRSQLSCLPAGCVVLLGHVISEFVKTEILAYTSEGLM